MFDITLCDLLHAAVRGLAMGTSMAFMWILYVGANDERTLSAVKVFGGTAAGLFLIGLLAKQACGVALT